MPTPNLGLKNDFGERQPLPSGWLNTVADELDAVVEETGAAEDAEDQADQAALLVGRLVLNLVEVLGLKGRAAAALCDGLEEVVALAMRERG